MRYPRQDGRRERGWSRLLPGVQNAIMHLQDWAEDRHLLDVHGIEREPTLTALQILQRPDVENLAREIPEYFADATTLEWVGPGQPLERSSGATLATDSGATSSDS